MKREYKNELMDDFSINGDRIDNALKELQAINTYLGGNSTTNAGFKLLNKNSYRWASIIVLDAGAGASDVLLKLKQKFNGLKIIPIDANLAACNFIKKRYPKIDVIYGNTKELPLKGKSVDVIHASLFFHHFNEDNILSTLREFSVTGRKAIIINDLRRSVWAYIGIKFLTALFSRSDMVKNDAPLSVKRGFKKEELIRILDQLDYKYIIQRKWAFRWLVVVFLN